MFTGVGENKGVGDGVCRAYVFDHVIGGVCHMWAENPLALYGFSFDNFQKEVSHRFFPFNMGQRRIKRIGKVLISFFFQGRLRHIFMLSHFQMSRNLC